MAETPNTVDNWGRLVGYTWGEVKDAGTTWENVNALSYGVLRSFIAAHNAGDGFYSRLTNMREKLEESNLYSLSSVETALNNTENALTDLINAFN